MPSLSAAFLADWIDTSLAGKSARTRESYRYVLELLFRCLELGGHPTDLRELKPMHFRSSSSTKARHAPSGTPL